jgi:hypothetical protein
MAIPSRQIGWSTKSNLLWQISKQLEALTGVMGRNIPATTTTTSTSTTAAPSYTIGQSALGGIVAYINGGGISGTSGFIVSSTDISSVWGCAGIDIPGADGTAIGTGAQNTIDILAGCSETGIAAQVCADLTEGGYSDWYLPSKDEMHELFLNRMSIGMNNSNNYWTSSEFDANTVWYQYFGYDYQGQNSKGGGGCFARAIRSF